MICARLSFPTGVLRAFTSRSTVFCSSSVNSRNRSAISSLSLFVRLSPSSSIPYLPDAPLSLPPRLTLPPITPPLPDVDGAFKGALLEVVRPLVHDGYPCRTVEHDEGQLRQVDLMDLVEDILPRASIRCRQFLFVEGIQGRVAIEGRD